MSEELSPLRALLEASADSPLTEADPKSLNELMQRIAHTFNTDPMERDPASGQYLLTDKDIATNVKYFQLNRAKFAQLAKEKAEAGPKPRGKKASSNTISEALARQGAQVEL
jgi:hypothetical protein